ncbi:MAG: hypothetical protein ACW98F_17805, partial [Candidatus Hodarchaeales archaeon]
LFEENATASTDVKIEIIWDQILFLLSFPTPWNDSIRFDVGSPAFVYIEGIYRYDSEPFTGRVELYHRNYSFVDLNENETLVIITQEMANSFPLNEPDQTLILISGVISDKYNLTSITVRKKYDPDPQAADFLILRWDRIIIDFEYENIGTNRNDIVPGDSVNISLRPSYQSDQRLVTSLKYSLLKDGDAFYDVNRSLLYFIDSEKFVLNHTYQLINVYDQISHLTDSYWLLSNGSISPIPEYTIFWEDTYHAPQLLEPMLFDYGNGTVGFAVITSDDNLEGLFYGSGVANVTVQLQIEGVAGQPWGTEWVLDKTGEEPFGDANIFYFFGIVETDPDNIIDFFSYETVFKYKFTLIDYNGNSIEETYETSASEDKDAPLIQSLDLKFSEEIDGNLNITILAFDYWSGVESATIQFYDSLSAQWEIVQEMNKEDYDISIVKLSYSTTFTVGDSIEYRLLIYDKFGNLNSTQGVIEVSDMAGPQLLEGKFSYIDFGVFSLNITVGDNGSDIKSATLYYKTTSDWIPINMTEVLSLGGSGSSNADLYRDNKIFQERFTVPPLLIEDKQEVQFQLTLEDDAGNRRTYNNQELASLLALDFVLNDNGYFELPSILIDFVNIPFVIPLMILLLIGFALVTIQRFRTISGFDKKKIMEELIKISENEVWEENDKISLGIVVNFFDQTRGPIPIIYYPEKLSASETMAFALADRSFSTLGFVGNPDDDNHDTYRFQIGAERTQIFAYSFAKKDPEARGGQENLSLSFIIRDPWGNLENVNRFLAELLEYSRKIRVLALENADMKIIQKEMEILRNFFTRAMLTFRRKYEKEFVE